MTKRYDKDPEQMSSPSLAYLGDAVIELLVRRKLVTEEKKAPYSIEALDYVTASSQSVALDKIMDILTEEELDVFKRGRNNVHAAIPKSATAAEYRKATGLECLFAYLYLKGEDKRIDELFGIAYSKDDEKETDGQ